MTQDRASLRRQLRQRRRELPAAARIAAAEALAGRILALSFLPREGYVAGYWAMDGEIGLHVLQLRLPPGLVYCLPLLHGDVLRFAPGAPAIRWSPTASASPNRMSSRPPACAPRNWRWR